MTSRCFEMINIARMELLDLPEECILHIFEYLPVKGVIACSETCQRMRALMPSNVLWLPRLCDEFGVDLKIIPTSSRPVEARTIYKAVRQCKPEAAIRFWGCYTDGGCDLNMRQYWVDHIFAPNSLESYCSATRGNVHCVGVLTNPKGAEARDEEKTRYREYLLRRLRVPAGVVFGHGLVDLAVIQGSEEVDSAVMQRLQANSLAELEHLFLEFYQELMAGNTLGRLLLHGLVGNERESERARMTSVAAGIDLHIGETNDALKLTHEDTTRLFDHSVLPHLGCSGEDSAPTAVGVLEKLAISRTGHFSCPVRAGVIFVANCNPHICRSEEEIRRSIMELADRKECRVFDDLKDEKALAEAVKSGKLPPRSMHRACAAGVHFTFGPATSSASSAAGAGSHAVGPLRPVAWFKFHTRQEARSWNPEPVTVWEGQDPDLARTSNAGSQLSASSAPENTRDEAGPSGVGADMSEDEFEKRSAQAEASLAAYASNSGVAGFVGDIGQMAAAWLGGGNPASKSESSGSDYKPPDTDSEGSAEIDLEAYSAAEEDGISEDDLSVDQDDNGSQPDDDDDTDIDMDGEPRGTKGRNLMDIELPARVAGNVVLVKLIDQEDLMHEWDDQHSSPNIDINHVIFSGRTVHLPQGALLST